MLLAADIGNSSISFGIFGDGCELLHRFKLAADQTRTSDEYAVIINNVFALRGIDPANITGTAIASVVPMLTKTVEDALRTLTGTKTMTVGPGVKTGFPIRIDDPSELGADLVANAAAVIAMQGNKIAAIIVDMGTATTVSAISQSGEYLGNCIMPGVRVSLDSLHSRTAQLPTVTLAMPKRAIGKNSGDSVRSGVVLGNAIMIDGFIDEFAKEMKLDALRVDLFATGGLAEQVLPACKHKFTYDPDLTLKGLYFIYKNNIG